MTNGAINEDMARVPPCPLERSIIQCTSREQAARHVSLVPVKRQHVQKEVLLLGQQPDSTMTTTRKRTKDKKGTLLIR